MTTVTQQDSTTGTKINSLKCMWRHEYCICILYTYICTYINDTEWWNAFCLLRTKLDRCWALHPELFRNCLSVLIEEGKLRGKFLVKLLSLAGLLDFAHRRVCCYGDLVSLSSTVPNRWCAFVAFVHLQRWCRRFVFLLNSLTDSDGDLGLANRIRRLTNVCPCLYISTVGAWLLILKVAFASCLLGTWGPSKHLELSSKQTTECLSLQVIQFTSHKRRN